MIRHEAHIEKNWRDHGLAHLLVARIRADGSADIGVFLVDVFCLGVKDAFLETDVPASMLQNFVALNLPEERRETISPACARKLIEGVIAYAEKLGFAPHRDHRKARRVLSGIEASACAEEFTFGCHGRPCYVQGAEDDEARVERVLAILEARCGPDGFDYELADEEEPSEDEIDIQDVRQALKNLLDAEPADVPRFYQLNGMVTALHICPTTVMPSLLHDALWGKEGRKWEGRKELEAFTVLLNEYWNFVGELVADAADDDAPVGTQAIDLWTEDFPDERELGVAMVEWAAGFWRTTELWPQAWGDALLRPDLAPHWEVVGWWAKFSVPGNQDRIAGAAEGNPPRTLAQSVAALARALRR
ncbi:MAG: UPF0149 family protein [Opitutaceae bacterium]